MALLIVAVGPESTNLDTDANYCSHNLGLPLFSLPFSLPHILEGLTGNFWFFSSTSVFIYFTVDLSLTSCLSFFSVRKAALTQRYLFLAPLALFPTPPRPPSLGACSSDLGNARTALPFHLGSRNILQLHKYSSIQLLTLWAV